MTPENNSNGQPRADLISTGIEGLDLILGGGFARERMYLVEGIPGSGKTTLCLQFLLAGVALGERVLYISLSETEEELRAAGASHGWSLAQVNIRELAASETSLKPEQQYSLFHPSEVELSQTTQTIFADAERIRPSRVAFDSLSELRLLAGNPLRYRRQILALKHFFMQLPCTVLIVDDRSSSEQDRQLETLAHAVISLELRYPEYGAERRRMRVSKYRGARFRGGYHDCVINTGGLVVFPRIIAAEHRRGVPRAVLSSGIRELDQLMGGGIDSGTSTLITGSAGTGKSTLAVQFAIAAAKRGRRAALFLFDESLETLTARTAGLSMPLTEHIEAGRISVQQIDPAEMSPGELGHSVATAAHAPDMSIIVIDSLNGYLNAMPEDGFLSSHLHEMLAYLGHLGIATILVGVQRGLTGTPMIGPIDASYLADGVILTRYFEHQGHVRQAISILKRRSGAHERTIREFRLSETGIQVGEPLAEFRGVLTGTPVYEGGGRPLLREA